VWCVHNLGFVPDIVYKKDHLMITLYDDRVIQVVPNTGDVIEDMLKRTIDVAHKMHEDLGWAMHKIESKRNGFLAGLMLGVLINCLIWAGFAVIDHYKEKTSREQKIEQLHKAIHDIMEENWK